MNRHQNLSSHNLFLSNFKFSFDEKALLSGLDLRKSRLSFQMKKKRKNTGNFHLNVHARAHSTRSRKYIFFTLTFTEKVLRTQRSDGICLQWHLRFFLVLVARRSEGYVFTEQTHLIIKNNYDEIRCVFEMKTKPSNRIMRY